MGGYNVDEVVPQPLEERERVAELLVEQVNLRLGRHRA